MMSRLLEQDVASVEVAVTEGVIGDDAVGTDRAWVRVILCDGKSMNLFVKVPTHRTWLRVLLTLTGLYENELNFYTKTRHHFEKDLAMPQVHYAAQEGSRFILILEDLKSSGCKLMNLFQACNVEEAETVLRWLARYHAKFWGRSAEVWSESMRPPVIKIILMGTLWQTKKKFPDLLPKHIEDIYRRFVANYSSVRRYWDQGPSTFVHGDTHNGNLYFTSDGRCGFYDFQVVSRESPMRDVAYFLQMSMNPSDLASEEKRLVQLYLADLDACLDAENVPRDASQRLTPETAFEQYRSHALYSLLALLVTSGAGDFVQNRESVEEIGKRAKAAVERLDVRGLLDQIL